MAKKILLIDIKGKLYKLRLSSNIDINVKLNMDIGMPDMIVNGLNDEEESEWEVLISLRNNDSMRSLLETLTSEFYQDRDILFKFDTLHGFTQQALVLRVSKRDMINGLMLRTEEIARIPITNMKLKRSTPW